MITLYWVYMLAGLMFAAFAVLGLRDASNPRRIATAGFWGLMSVSMLAGDRLGDAGNGLLALALVGLVAVRGLGKGVVASESGDREALAQAHGNRLFLLALVIPAAALVGTLAFPLLPDMIEKKNATLIALAGGVLIALAIGQWWLKPRALLPLQEGRRLMDSIGWAAILPQMLASLGALFAAAGVGTVVGQLVQGAIPANSLAAAVIAYAVGMALFTIIMGNAFAAFPVMIAAVGVPVLIRQFHGDPAVVAAIGMLAGFCGTLLTPMAANFNLVPAALLELKSPYAVIRAQVGTAVPLLIVNTALIYWLAF